LEGILICMDMLSSVPTLPTFHGPGSILLLFMDQLASYPLVDQLATALHLQVFYCFS